MYDLCECAYNMHLNTPSVAEIMSVIADTGDCTAHMCVQTGETIVDVHRNSIVERVDFALVSLYFCLMLMWLRALRVVRTLRQPVSQSKS